MKTLHCPRCEKPFDPVLPRCPQCGLKTCKAFSARHGCLLALLLNLLIVTLFVLLFGLWKKQGLTLSTWFYQADGCGFVAMIVCLLTPGIFLYRVYRMLWLRFNGLVGTGTVVAHRLKHMRRRRSLEVAVVQFLPDIAHPRVCEVESGLWSSVAPEQSKVSVLYDPYHPDTCAQVGMPWGDLVFCCFMSLSFLGLSVLLVWAMFST